MTTSSRTGWRVISFEEDPRISTEVVAGLRRSSARRKTEDRRVSSIRGREELWSLGSRLTDDLVVNLKIGSSKEELPFVVLFDEGEDVLQKGETRIEKRDQCRASVEVVTELTSIALGMTPGSDLLPVRVKVFPDLRFERNEEGKERSTKRTRPSKGEMWDSRSLSVSKDHSVESLHRRSTH